MFTIALEMRAVSRIQSKKSYLLLLVLEEQQLTQLGICQGNLKPQYSTFKYGSSYRKKPVSKKITNLHFKKFFEMNHQLNPSFEKEDKSHNQQIRDMINLYSPSQVSFTVWHNSVNSHG